MNFGARTTILDRIRTALGPATAEPSVSHAHIARNYNRIGKLAAEARLELLIDRLIDYDTEIFEVVTEQEIAQTIAETLQQSNETRVIAPAAFNRSWIPASPAVTMDHNLPISAIEDAQAVLTTCEAAVASTGTIFLVHSGARGRRVLTLLPDHHICVLRRDQVFELVPEAIAHITPHARQPITTISGPSATSDIEMTRIRGVHGPRRLTVILYGHLSE